MKGWALMKKWYLSPRVISRRNNKRKKLPVNKKKRKMLMLKNKFKKETMLISKRKCLNSLAESDVYSNLAIAICYLFIGILYIYSLTICLLPTFWKNKPKLHVSIRSIVNIEASKKQKNRIFRANPSQCKLLTKRLLNFALAAYQKTKTVSFLKESSRS